ncbi:MAG: hypothetical protein QM778_37945 [Myxococcales bacterium]
MTRRSSLLLFLMVSTACGGDGASGSAVKVGEGVDINNDGVQDGIALDTDGDGVADSVDLDGDGMADAILPWAKPSKPDSDKDAGSDDAGSDPGSGDGDGDGDKPPVNHGDGDGDGDGDAPLDIEIPLAKVQCGNSECAIKEDFMCCDGWNVLSGFKNQPKCITEDACTITPTLDEPDDPGLYYIVGTLVDRAITSTCDGREDCKDSQVCCYVRQGSPIGSLDHWSGPGAGRQCMDLDACLDVGAANGVPTGVLSCNDNDDCQKAPGKTCQPEQDKSVTTGDAASARPGYKVCR